MEMQTWAYVEWNIDPSRKRMDVKTLDMLMLVEVSIHDQFRHEAVAGDIGESNPHSQRHSPVDVHP